MPKYTTATSDKKKKTALKWWAIGCLGLFGIENFYVGKSKRHHQICYRHLYLAVALCNGR